MGTTVLSSQENIMELMMLKSRHTLWVYFIILLTIPIFAIASVGCDPTHMLQSNFSMTHYKTCRSLIKQCPIRGPLPDIDCVNKKVADNKTCSQLQQLADMTQGMIAAITVEKNNHLLLVDQFYPGDGQHHYYFVANKRCLLDTHIDPRKLDKTIKDNYKNKNFMIVNWNKPIYHSYAGGRETYNYTLRITENCVACALVGFARYQMDFNHQGSLTQISLKQFKRE